MSARARRPVGLLLVAALLVALSWGGWAWTQRDRVDVGLVKADLNVDSRADLSSYLELPEHRLSLSAEVGDRGVDEGDDEHRAPRGGRLVELSWELSANQPAQPDAAPVQDPDVVLWLRAGGRDVQVARDASKDGHENTSGERRPWSSQVVAVAGESGPIEVIAEYAGRRQSVDLATGDRAAGSFAGLYRPSTRGQQIRDERSPLRADGVSWMSDAWLTPTRTPYLAERGWAPAGKEWLVLDTAITVKYVHREVGDGWESYDEIYREPARATLTIGGRAPLDAGERSGDGRGYDRWAGVQTKGAVFLVTESEAVTVRIGLTAPLADDRTDRRTTVSETYDLDVPAQPVIAAEQVR